MNPTKFFLLANTTKVSDSTMTLVKEITDRGWQLTEPDYADVIVISPDFSKPILTIGSPVVKPHTNIANFLYRNFLL